ncbi:Allantoate permease [Rasamsonia emersonii CBS 393.64]|uniref:Allantoate permease n=1 Tax=Rasamsonia emersonii (strain ATCC 16479 / CBS 393.64 / IMI 116815) TaxID=1408163 RepID=A0A0F4YHU9_RASE3|nr:Allantoate permease [Rasamsonia emersonii CBS 393.64]KKA17862.1 Allantoate permease [Rasamsonia emersonii CBS 393.64]
MGIPDIEKTHPHPVTSITGHVDAALEFLQAEGTTAAVSTIDERKLVRKIDCMIMPLMWACYNLQYLDKVLIILWGVMTTLNCTASTFGGLMTLRILLGVFESAIAPALILITSMWYKRHEQPIRMAAWYIGTGTASIMGGLVAYGLLFYSADKFRSWQLLFLIIGLVTVVVGVAVIVFLPDNPMSSRLSHAEKICAIERLRENKTGIENKRFKKEQFYEVFTDPQTYLIAVVVAAMDVLNAAGSSFSALIIQSFGSTTKQTELLSIPGGVISVVSILIGNYIAGRTNQRCLVAIISFAIGLAGSCLMTFVSGKAIRLAGNYLMSCSGPALPLIFENARRDRAQEGVLVQHQENSEFLDLTDRQNREFRVSSARSIRTSRRIRY